MVAESVGRADQICTPISLHGPPPFLPSMLQLSTTPLLVICIKFHPPRAVASSTSTQPQVAVANFNQSPDAPNCLFAPRGSDARSLRAPCPANRPWCGGVHPLPCTSSSTQHASSRSLLYQCVTFHRVVRSIQRVNKKKRKHGFAACLPYIPISALKLIFSSRPCHYPLHGATFPPMSTLLSATRITPAYWPILLDRTRQLSSFDAFTRLD